MLFIESVIIFWENNTLREKNALSELTMKLLTTKQHMTK